MTDPFPSVEKVRTRPPAGKWGVIDNDGNRACWWCLCTVHPSVAELHDLWHFKTWSVDDQQRERDAATRRGLEQHGNDVMS